MDEGGNRYVLRRSGIYEELVNYVTLRYDPRGTGECYFIEDPICPEPTVVDEFFRDTLGTASVDIAPAGQIEDVVQEGSTVVGVIAAHQTRDHPLPKTTRRQRDLETPPHPNPHLTSIGGSRRGEWPPTKEADEGGVFYSRERLFLFEAVGMRPLVARQ